LKSLSLAKTYAIFFVAPLLITLLSIVLVGERVRKPQWAALLEQYYAVVRREVSRFRGEEVNTAGDGFFASFDGPARAARCAFAIRDAVASLGLQIRAGLHTGECEVIDGQLGGIAVHIGARVAAHAEPGEILASSTVRDLVVGSQLRFTDQGVHSLKGLSGEFRLFLVEV